MGEKGKRMDKKNVLAAAAILIIGGSIILNGYFVGEAIKSAPAKEPTAAAVDTKVLNLSQAAEYMNMSEEEVQSIIRTESDILSETHSFSGKMFPYFTISGKQYFYKDEIDAWLSEVSVDHRAY